MEFDFKLCIRVDNPEIYNCKEVDLEDYRVKKPVVFVIPGKGANSNKDINGYLKVIKSQLGVFNQDVDLVGLCYKDGTATTHFEEANVAKVVRNFFLPLVTSENGERLTLKEACKNMRNLTIFAHCFGVEMANQFTERLMDEMHYLHYTDEEQLEILSQVVMIGFASWTTNTKFTTVNIVSPYDTLFEDRGKVSWEDVLLKFKEMDMSPEDRKYFEDVLNQLPNRDLEGLEGFYGNKQRCFVVPHYSAKHQSLSLVCSKLYKNASDHYARGFALGGNWEPHEWLTEAGYTFVKCSSCILCNSVANSIINRMKKEFVPFNMKNNVQKQLEEVVRPLNEDRTDIYKEVIVKDK